LSKGLVKSGLILATSALYDRALLRSSGSKHGDPVEPKFDRYAMSYEAMIAACSDAVTIALLYP